MPELFKIAGVNTNLAKSKLQKANKLRFYNELLAIDQTPTKKHLPRLCDYFIEGNPTSIIQSYYERFLTII